MKKVFKEAEIKDLISKVSGNEITFSRLVEILNEKVEDISKPSEDIKQAIEAFANSQYNKDATLICANSLRESIESYEDGKRDGIIIGAEFALRLSENSGQVDDKTLIEMIINVIYDNTIPFSGCDEGRIIKSYEKLKFISTEITKLIPSKSQENDLNAEFALNLSENSGQVHKDLVKKITDILLKNHHGAGFTIHDFEVTAFKIAALIASSRSQENGAELLEAAKQILDLHVCEMEGLSSGQPTPTEWMNAVDKLSEAISNYENKANENTNVCM